MARKYKIELCELCNCIIYKKKQKYTIVDACEDCGKVYYHTTCFQKVKEDTIEYLYKLKQQIVDHIKELRDE